MSQEALYRAIVGQDVELALRINEVPRPYRQTLPAPLAPPESEAVVPPITEIPNPSSPL